MTQASTLTLTRPDDWHLHVRDGAVLTHVVPHTAAQFGRAIIMPNLKRPITTTAQALAYRLEILQATPSQSKWFEPLMTLYLTDETTPEEIQRAKDTDFVLGIKFYPAGATTNSESGVTDIRRCYKTLEAMQRLHLPLLVHGEVTDPSVDVFDREAVFVERVLHPLRRDFPALKVVFEHISTQDAVDYVRTESNLGPIAATVTAHHLRYNRNALFQGGLRPHYYCLPVLKREVHRQALLRAATSGDPRFFLGTDSAPHSKTAKEHACGCAGCYTAFHAMALYAHIFDQAGALDQLEAFASWHGPAFYGLPRNTDTITLERRPWRIPETLSLGEQASLVPLGAGETLDWALLDSQRHD